MNIPYILAGLLIILLVSLLLWRRRKARKPRYSDSVIVNDNIDSKPVDIDSPSTTAMIEDDLAKNAPIHETRFDSVTVAQRFIDQQNYDKAVETLDRGLVEDPHDNQLLLKLLHVYAITNQHDDFYTIYNITQTYGDVATLKQAEKFKDLLDPNKRTQSTSTIMTSDSLSLDDELNLTENFHSSSTEDIESDNSLLDFDVTELYLNDDTALEAIDNIKENDAFDLTLDDLEITQIDNDAVEDIFKLDDSPKLEDSLNSESTLDFDLSVENSASESELNLSNDIVFDFDELIKDDEADVIEAENSLNVEPANQHYDNDELSLEDLDFLDDSTINKQDQQPSVESDKVLSEQLLVVEDDSLLDLEDDSLIESAPVLEDTSSFDANINENKVDANDSSPLVFDDNTPIDDNFDFDTLSGSTTATTPVSTESENLDSPDNLVADSDNDFAAQFAADFDFVNILDNQQVTLDLAEQYLQLGEYDSAKRLLSEVIEQGNNEQQQQAQELLSRTT